MYDTDKERISVAGPPSRWIFTALLAAFLLALAAFLLLGHYTRRETVEGRVVPDGGVATLSSPVAGQVTKVMVIPGQSVQKNALLMVVATDVEDLQGRGEHSLIEGNLQHTRDAISQKLADHRAVVTAKTSALQSRLTSIQARRVMLRAQSDLVSKKAAAASELLRKISPLETKGLVSGFQIQQQRAAVIDGEIASQVVASQLAELDQQNTDTRAELAQLPSQAAMDEATIRGELDKLDQDMATARIQQGISLRANQAGVISTVRVHGGDSVSPGAVLLTMVAKDSPLHVELYVPGRSIGFIHTGDAVNLRYEAFPYQKFGIYRGKVANISPTAVVKRDLEELPTSPKLQASESAIYLVEVAIEEHSLLMRQNSILLKPGMTVSADVLLDRRAWWEWVFLPLRGLAQRASGETQHG